MNAWPQGVIVVPTVATTVTQYAAEEARPGTTSELRGVAPIGVGQHRGDEIGERDADPDRHEQVLDPAVAPRVSSSDHDRGGEQRAGPGRHAEEPQGRAAAGELGHDRADVGHEHGADHEGGPAHAELLAHEPCQALTGGKPEPRADFLREEEHDLAGQQHPQQLVAVPCAGHRVRGDAARVVVGEAAHQPRAQDAQDRGQADAIDRARGERQDRGPHRSEVPEVRPKMRGILIRAGRRQQRVDGVVDGDDALEVTLAVHDRHGQQVVAGHDLGDLLLAGVGPDRHGLVVHERGDARVRLGHDQVPQRQDADQPAVRRR